MEGGRKRGRDGEVPLVTIGREANAASEKCVISSEKKQRMEIKHKGQSETQSSRRRRRRTSQRRTVLLV